jgi:hypothetical protein
MEKLNPHSVHAELPVVPSKAIRKTALTARMNPSNLKQHLPFLL